MVAYQARQEPEEALAAAQRLADRFRQQGEKREEAATMRKIAAVHLKNKEPDQALRAGQEALAASRALGDKWGEAAALRLLAQVRLDKQEPGEALRAAESALALYKRLGSDLKEDGDDVSGATGSRLTARDGEVAALEASVSANSLMGGMDEAAHIAYEAQQRFRSQQEKKGQAAMLLSLAEVHLAKQEIDEALNALVQAPALFMAVGDKRSEAIAWHKIAQLHLSRGEGGLALRAAEESLGAYRKLGDKRGKATLSQLIADVHFALAAVGAGNGQAALRAAQEAVSLYQDLGDKVAEAVSLHILANAQLMTRSYQDALKTARDAEVLFKDLSDSRGEAGALLLAAGAHLGEGEFEEAKRIGKDAADLFRQLGDFTGEDTAQDFVDNIKSYETGQLNRADFCGFSMRGADAGFGGSTAVQAQPRRERAPRKPRQMSNLSDIELIKADGSRETKTTLAIFEGFETRQAGKAPRPAGARGGSAPGGTFSSQFEDGIEKRGAPQREQVLYSVRWVQCAAGRGTSPSGSRRGGREFTKVEDKRITVPLELGAPREGWGSRAGLTSRLFEAVGEQRGV